MNEITIGGSVYERLDCGHLVELGTYCPVCTLREPRRPQAAATEPCRVCEGTGALFYPRKVVGGGGAAVRCPACSDTQPAAAPPLLEPVCLVCGEMLEGGKGPWFCSQCYYDRRDTPLRLLRLCPDVICVRREARP